MHFFRVLFLVIPVVVALTQVVPHSGRGCRIFNEATIYCVYKQGKTWVQAFTACLKNGEDLSDYSSRVEHDFILELAAKEVPGKGARVWLGATDLENSIYRWSSNGRVIPTAHWHPNEPNFRDRQKCAALVPSWNGTKFALDNFQCEEKLAYVCKY